MSNAELITKSFIDTSHDVGGLTIFDMDDTLIKSHAQVHVIDAQGNHTKLRDGEFKDYKLASGERFSFEEFNSSLIFKTTSSPIDHMIEHAQDILHHIAHREKSRVIILTARSDFDNQKMFFDTLNQHGIDTKKIIVEFAGNVALAQDIFAPQAKKVVIDNYLKTNEYDQVRLFDDYTPNLDKFLELKPQYPHIEFSAFLVNRDGSVSTYK
jgi:hypothetical protein